MDRLRNLTTQTKRRQTQAQSIDEEPAGHIEQQDIPPILPTILDGAVENIHSSDYAKRCREIIDLSKALIALGYVFFYCVGGSCLPYSSSNPVCMPLSTFPAWSLSGDNQVSAHDHILSTLITYTGGKSSLVEAVSGVSICTCNVVSVASDSVFSVDQCSKRCWNMYSVCFSTHWYLPILTS